MNKRNILFSIVVVIMTVMIVMVISTSCIRIVGYRGSGNVSTQERTVRDFDSVSVSAGINLFIEQGDDGKLIVEAEDNIISKISTDVRNGRLEIKFKWTAFGGINPNKPVNIYLTILDLDEIDISGGAEVESAKLKLDKLELDISSGASADLIIEVDDLDVDLSSGADLKISGNASNQKVDISSAGYYNAKGLESKTADLDISSGADAVIWVTGKLDVDISSGGSVEYIGSPEITSNISSGGSIRSISG